MREHANVLKVLMISVFQEFIAPSHVWWLSDSKRQAEGVSSLHISQGQLTGWNLIALK